MASLVPGLCTPVAFWQFDMVYFILKEVYRLQQPFAAGNSPHSASIVMHGHASVNAALGLVVSSDRFWCWSMSFSLQPVSVGARSSRVHHPAHISILLLVSLLWFLNVFVWMKAQSWCHL